MRRCGALECDISACSCLRVGTNGANWVSGACNILMVQPRSGTDIVFVYLANTFRVLTMVPGIWLGNRDAVVAGHIL